MTLKDILYILKISKKKYNWMILKFYDSWSKYGINFMV
jgi:hypothetical protein